MLHQSLSFFLASAVQDSSDITSSISCAILGDADIASSVSSGRGLQTMDTWFLSPSICPWSLQFPFAFQLNQLVLLLHEYQSFCCPVLLQLLQPLVICSLTVFPCCPLHVLLAHHQIFQTSCLLSNVESHTVRFVGDTDHGTMFETVATVAKQEWVRSFWDSWCQRTYQKQRVDDSRCCKLRCSREWVAIPHTSRTRGKHGKIRWKSATTSWRQSWTTTWNLALCRAKHDKNSERTGW